MPDLQGRHRNRLTELEAGLVEVVTEPAFAIGQRALLVQTPHGNLLWDCLTMIDLETVTALNGLGGVDVMAISHPHFYGAVASWATALDCPRVLLPAADREHLMHRHPSIVHFDEVEMSPLEGLRLIRVGGHFLGSTVLHWPGGAGGRGVLLSGDSIAVVADRRHVTFLYSYPNRIPLAAADVRMIAQRCRPLAFDRLYSGFSDGLIASGAHAAVLRSAERYVGMLEGNWPRL